VVNHSVQYSQLFTAFKVNIWLRHKCEAVTLVQNSVTVMTCHLIHMPYLQSAFAV